MRRGLPSRSTKHFKSTRAAAQHEVCGAPGEIDGPTAALHSQIRLQFSRVEQRRAQPAKAAADDADIRPASAPRAGGIAAQRARSGELSFDIVVEGQGATGAPLRAAALSDFISASSDSRALGAFFCNFWPINNISTPV